MGTVFDDVFVPWHGEPWQVKLSILYFNHLLRRPSNPYAIMTSGYK